MSKKTINFFVFSALLIIVLLINISSLKPQERYECSGAIFDKFRTEVKTYDEDNNLISSKKYDKFVDEEVEAKGEQRVIDNNAKVTIIYTPWSFISQAVDLFSRSGVLAIYEESMDIYKIFRVERYVHIFFIKDKENKEWGSFDELTGKIYIGLPNKDKKIIAFIGKCKRSL